MQILEMTKEFGETSHIYAKSWKAAYRGIVPQTYLDNLTPESWTSFLANSPFHNYLLRDNDIFIATAAIGKARDSRYNEYGEIVSIYVLPEFFGKGYGTVLFRYITDKLKSMGYDKMYLWVLEENYKARRFYEKMEFVFNGDRKVTEISGKKLVEICYVNAKISTKL